jgi:VWFA-related protein
VCKTAVISIVFLVSAIAAFGQKPEPAPAAPAPVSYGFVVDNSGSYRTLLEKVIKMVSDLAAENKPGDEAFLVTFVDTSKIALRQEFTESTDELRDAAESMFIEGGFTSIVDAVKSSADYLSENAKTAPERTRALVLITDGDERKSTANIEDVLKTLKAANIKVFVIAISDEKVYPKVIDRLTKETGGTKYTPKTRDEIAAAVKSLSAAIRVK